MIAAFQGISKVSSPTKSTTVKVYQKVVLVKAFALINVEANRGAVETGCTALLGEQDQGVVVGVKSKDQKGEYYR